VAFIPISDTNPLRRIRWPLVSWALIAANVAVYFFIESGSFLREPQNASSISFGLVPAVVNGADPASLDLMAVPFGLTLISYSFLHASFWHLAGNMIFLWVFADNVEDALGHFRYLVFYVICAVAAGYAFVLAAPDSTAPVIGASGAVAGTLAAYLLLYPRAKVWILLFFGIPLHLRVEYVIGAWILFQVYAAISGGGQNIAWWVHVGGLVTGAVLVVFMRQKGVPLFAAALPEHPWRVRKDASPADAAPQATDPVKGLGE
jgi:membrane associated rhomboid family serine protease